MSPSSTPTAKRSETTSSKQACHLKELSCSKNTSSLKRILDSRIRVGDEVISDYGYHGTVVDSIGTDFFFINVAGYATPGGWHREHLHKLKLLMAVKWLRGHFKRMARRINENEDVRYFTTNGYKKKNGL